jgi:hypothetical protein
MIMDVKGCPLGKASFLTRSSMVKQCKAYQTKGVLFLNERFVPTACEHCMIPEHHTYVPNNVTIKGDSK